MHVKMKTVDNYTKRYFFLSKIKITLKHKKKFLALRLKGKLTTRFVSHST